MSDQPDTSESPEGRWCLVGNIVDWHRAGEGGVELKQGTKHFSPGTKVYCLPSQWGDGYENIVVIGKHRGQRRMHRLVMSFRYVTNCRDSSLADLARRCGKPMIYLPDFQTTNQPQRITYIGPLDSESQHEWTHDIFGQGASLHFGGSWRRCGVLSDRIYYGYLNWMPELRNSRFVQACDSGVFFLVASVILDPILYFSFYSYFAKKWRGDDPV